MKLARALTNALIGALLTAPLIIVFYSGWKLLELPFAPFGLFNGLTRILPGPIATMGVEAIVQIIRALKLGTIATASKAGEQIMSVAIFFIAGTVIGGTLFQILKTAGRFATLIAICVGVACGLAVALASTTLNRTSFTNPTIGFIWIVIAFAIWGLAFEWVHSHLPASAGAANAVDTNSRASVEQIDRRQFLIRLGGATAAITVIGAGISTAVGSRRMGEVASADRFSTKNALPNVNAPVAPVPGTRAEFTRLEDHYRIDIDTLPMVVAEKDWRLRIGGLVHQPLELMLEQVRNYEPMHQFITLMCVSNPVGGDLTSTTRWTGVSLKRLLPDLGLKPNATHLKISSVDDFHEVVALETIRADERVMLTYAWDGLPLLQKHGFPLRIYIPDRYGMKQPKWIESIEAIDHWEAGYWTERGWDREGLMQSTSVIDTITVDEAHTDAAGHKSVLVGGIAHAGARGVSKVEVQVDGGAWQAAQLRPPLSNLTWVVWRYAFPFQAGAHNLTVRCVDGNGVAQVVEVTPTHPKGATGLDIKTATL